MKKFNGSMSMSEAVRRMVDDSGLPVKAIAAETGKGYTTLYRELDSEDDGAKIGVDTLPLLIRACCGDAPQEPPLPLVVLAARFGFRLVSDDVQPDKDDVRDECLDDGQALAAFHRAVREGKANPHTIEQMAMELATEIAETSAAYASEWERQNRELQ